jgi:hypothetical protein
MAEGLVAMITPQGGTMVGHGEEAHFPFQVITAQGPVWLTQVPAAAVPHLLKAGYLVAPDELQSCAAPQPPRRSLTNLMI